MGKIIKNFYAKILHLSYDIVVSIRKKSKKIAGISTRDFSILKYFN